MTEQQKQFLTRAVIDQKRYVEISKEMNIDQGTLSKWWDDLKEEREALSTLRKLWSKKCTETDFWDFKQWYESSERHCHYCKISESEIEQLIKAGLIRTKRLKTRGRKLEIERLLPNEQYDKLTNLVFCCYWCNNAKTDEFSSAEFAPIGQHIAKIWATRLKSRFQERFDGIDGLSIKHDN